MCHIIFFTAETQEDILVLGGMINRKQKLLEATSTYPLEFDRPDIKSRQKIFLKPMS